MVVLDAWRVVLAAVLVCMAVLLVRRAVNTWRHPKPYPTTHPAMHLSYAVVLVIVAEGRLERIGHPLNWSTGAATVAAVLALYGWFRSGLRLRLTPPWKR